MLLASLLVPALTSAAVASDPVPVPDPPLFDLSYAPLTSPPYDPAAFEPQTGNDWERGFPATRTYWPWYFGFHAGFTTTRTSRDADVELDFDDGYLLGAALGYRFGPPLRQAARWAVELELLWTDQDLEATGSGPITLQASSDMSVLAFLVNGLVDFLFTPQFGAYAGAGLGLSWVDVSGVVDDPFEFRDEDGPFLTWQLKAGLQAHLGPRSTVRLGYRFINIDDVELDDSIQDARFDLETRQHVIELGILFGF